jgi:hypothetical protein
MCSTRPSGPPRTASRASVRCSPNCIEAYIGHLKTLPGLPALDFSRVMSGPIRRTLRPELGAEVITVEPLAPPSA